MAYSGRGEGTKEFPYEVENAAQFLEINNDLTAHYIQVNDIDFNNAPMGVIADGVNHFLGHYDGQGYRLKNVLVEAADEGLAAHIAAIFYTVGSGGLVERMVVEGQINGGDEAGTTDSGGIAGNVINGEVRNCLVKARVIGDVAGGIAYDSETEGTLASCLFVGQVESAGGTIAGICPNGGEIINCWYDKTVNIGLIDEEVRGLTTEQLRGDASLPTGFDPEIWTKDPTPEEEYPYSYPRLRRLDDMAITKNNPMVSRYRSGQVGLLVNATTTDCTGNEELVAAPGAGKKIAIKRFAISSATATNFVLNAGTTAILGPYLTTTGGVPIKVEFADNAMPTLPENTALNMDAAGAGLVTITLEYDIYG